MKLIRILPLVLLIGLITPIVRAGIVVPVYAFNFTDGYSPESSLAVGGDGNFYGATHDGGAFNKGVAFRLATNGVFTLLATFDTTNGANPIGALVRGLDGNVY